MGLLEFLNREMEPTDALIFYSGSDDVYVEHRKIVNGLMGAGSPLDASKFSKMICTAEKYVSKQDGMKPLSGRVPPNLLYVSMGVDNMRLVWWRGREKRKMYFHEGLGIPNGEMIVPPMVYSVNGNSLSVWCFKGRKPKSVLYCAPFFNVYDDGRVCLGNSKTDRPRSMAFEDWMTYWEKMFWQSEFSSLIGSNPIDGNLSVETRKCIEKGLPFNMDILKKSNMKLNSVLR